MQTEVAPACVGDAPGIASEGTVPLVVDLDGTLLNSDLLIESAMGLFKQHPLSLFRILTWLRRGKAALKAEIVIFSLIGAALYMYI